MLKLVGMAMGISTLALVAGQGLIASRGAAPPTPPATAVPAIAATAGAAGQAVALSADSKGHFVADVRINGIFIKGLVDTGATSVAIPLNVARSIGIDPPRSDYTVRIQTANGENRGARVRLNDVRISTIVVRDVEAIVVESGLSTTLIGMTFIRRISSEMRGNTLTLRQ